MTDDETQLVRDFRNDVPEPDAATMRAAYAEATRPARRLTPPALTSRRWRLTALAAAAATCAVAGAAIYAAAHGGTDAARPRTTTPAHPLGFDPITLGFSRSGQDITSVAVTVQASIADAAMQLQVVQGSPYGPASSRQTVFQEDVPMTNVSSPAPGPSGTAALSTWSGTLSTSDWEGGCQDTPYSVIATVVPSGSSFASPPNGSMITEEGGFTCSASQ